MEFSIEAEQNELVYETSCPIPCIFREYKKVGDSLTGDNIIFESKDKRFENALFMSMLFSKLLC